MSQLLAQSLSIIHLKYVKCEGVVCSQLALVSKVMNRRQGIYLGVNQITPSQAGLSPIYEVFIIVVQSRVSLRTYIVITL